MLDTTRPSICHNAPSHALPNVLRKEKNSRIRGLALMKSAMPGPGSTMTLDAVLDMLAGTCPAPYDVVSHAVRLTTFVVEFEAGAARFPFRRILVRRL